jgi:hypothetical protein
MFAVRVDVQLGNVLVVAKDLSTIKVIESL